VGEAGWRWFDENIRRVVGDGRNTLFWYDNQVGEISLRLKFPCLFDLVDEMWRLGGTDGGRGWVWR